MTVIFTVVHHVSFSSLGLRAPERLVTLRQNVPSISPIIPLSAQVLEDLRVTSGGRHPVSAVDILQFSIFEEEGPQRWRVARVSDNFFELCGIVPVLGRSLLKSDFSESRREVTVISHRLWFSLFGGSEEVIGQRLTVEVAGSSPPPGFTPSLTIVGVLPPDLWLPWGQIDLILPVFFGAPSSTPTAPYLFAIARLSDEVPIDTGLDELDQAFHQIEFADRLPKEGRGLTTRIVAELHGGSILSELTLLWLASGALLLVICANLANLVQARSSRHRGELALRYALGANRLEAIRKPLTEAALLAFSGGALGVALVHFSLLLVRSMPASGLPRPEEIELNAGVLLFSVGATLFSLLFFGVVPAILESRNPLSNMLQSISGRTTEGRQMGRLRACMIAGEMTIAVALLVLATAALGSLARLRSIDTGFQTDQNLVFELDIPVSRLPEPAQQQAVSQDLLERYRSIPGVKSAAAANTLPFSFVNSILRYGSASDEQVFRANVRQVSTDYFKSMSIPLIAGRDLSQVDIENGRNVTLVNRKLAEQHWPGEMPLGHRLILPSGTELEIVGVVGDVREWQLTDPPAPSLYRPLAARGNISFVLRSSLGSAPLIESVRSETQQVDEHLIIHSFTSLTERIDRNIGSDRLTAGLLNVFALLCLILGALGVYSVMSYSVSGRRREVGVRMALGAGRREIRHQLISEGLKPALLGTGMGLLGVLAASSLLESIFYGFTATDSNLWLVGPAASQPGGHRRPLDPRVRRRPARSPDGFEAILMGSASVFPSSDPCSSQWIAESTG